MDNPSDVVPNRPSDAAIRNVLAQLIQHRRERLAAEAAAKAKAEAAQAKPEQEAEETTA